MYISPKTADKFLKISRTRAVPETINWEDTSLTIPVKFNFLNHHVLMNVNYRFASLQIILLERKAGIVKKK